MTAADMIALAPTLDLSDPLTRLAMADAIEDDGALTPEYAVDVCLLRQTERPVYWRDGGYARQHVQPVLTMHYHSFFWGERIWADSLYVGSCAGVERGQTRPGAESRVALSLRPTGDAKPSEAEKAYLARFADERARLLDEAESEENPPAA